jgi:hypothetical protein
LVLINSDKNNVAPMTNHSKTVVKNINVPYITQKKKVMMGWAEPGRVGATGF